MLQLFFTDMQPDFEAYGRISTEPLALFYLALINSGILLSLPTSNHIYLSFAHVDADIDRILDRVAAVLDTYDFGAVVEASKVTNSSPTTSRSLLPEGELLRR